MSRRRDAWSAGHGMSSRHVGQVDPGATGYGVEARLARELTLHLAQDSAALNIPTFFRDTGYYHLADDEAMNFGATRFREVHFNAATSPSASGVEALVGPQATGFAKRLAIAYAAAIACTLGIVNRGVKVRDDLAVLHQHGSMAAVLIEVAFITNSKDMAAYAAKLPALELALVNADRQVSGSPPMKRIPRLTWRKVRIPYRLKTV